MTRVEALASQPQSCCSDSHPLRILLVEDHPDTSRVLCRLLRHLGYSVTPAGTVAAALDALDAQSFDLLISDIGLPDGSGVDLMSAVRQQRSIPGIAVSGFGMDSDIARSLAAGFAVHLVKPINFHTLTENIDRLTLNR